MKISYRSDVTISAQQFIDVLKKSTLGERRPIDDESRIKTMLENGNILITAWHEDKLVGVARSVSDFSFCCYLSDLAVDEAYQHRGIGKELVRLTHEKAGQDKITLVLLAAPAAEKYYPKIGMNQFQQCYVIKRKL